MLIYAYIYAWAEGDQGVPIQDQCYGSSGSEEEEESDPMTPDEEEEEEIMEPTVPGEEARTSNEELQPMRKIKTERTAMIASPSIPYSGIARLKSGRRSSPPWASSSALGR